MRGTHCAENAHDALTARSCRTQCHTSSRGEEAPSEKIEAACGRYTQTLKFMILYKLQHIVRDPNLTYKRVPAAQDGTARENTALYTPTIIVRSQTDERLCAIVLTFHILRNPVSQLSIHLRRHTTTRHDCAPCASRLLSATVRASPAVRRRYSRYERPHQQPDQPRNSEQPRLITTKSYGTRPRQIVSGLIRGKRGRGRRGRDR